MLGNGAFSAVAVSTVEQNRVGEVVTTGWALEFVVHSYVVKLLMGDLERNIGKTMLGGGADCLLCEGQSCITPPSSEELSAS